MRPAALKNSITPKPAASLQVPFIDLKRQYLSLREQMLQAIDQVLCSGNYILGETTELFEKQMASYLSSRFVLGVANGTDALILALKALNIGQSDEVILPVNSFIATAGAIAAAGAKPVLCDVGEDLNIDVTHIESLLTKQSKAIIPVHLTGRPADMDSIMEIAKCHSLAVIEDAAQSLGAKHGHKMTGNIGQIGCFSLHPLKNLHVYGDGGVVCTDDEKIYEQIRLLRNHGLINRDTCQVWGLNSRLDALQASIASLTLSYLNQWNERRRETAKHYIEELRNVLIVPKDKPHEHAIYHNFIVLSEKRDALMQFLLSNGIETKIHYPIPIHLQPAAASLGYQKGDFPMAEQLAEKMLSLPIYSELQAEERDWVIDRILYFYENEV